MALGIKERKSNTACFLLLCGMAEADSVGNEEFASDDEEQNDAG
jgi:hypothetical protein